MVAAGGLDTPFEERCAPNLPGRNRPPRPSTGGSRGNVAPVPTCPGSGRGSHWYFPPAPRRGRGARRSGRHGRGAWLRDCRRRCDAAVPDDGGQRFRSLDVRLQHRRSDRRAPLARPGAVPLHHRRSAARQRRPHRPPDHLAGGHGRRPGAAVAAAVVAPRGPVSNVAPPGQEPARQPPALQRDQPRPGTGVFLSVGDQPPVRLRPPGQPAQRRPPADHRRRPRRPAEPDACRPGPPLPGAVQHAGRRLQGQRGGSPHRPGHLPAVVDTGRCRRAQRGSAGDHRLVGRSARPPVSAVHPTTRALPSRRLGRDRAAGPRTARRLLRQCPGDAGPGRGPGVLPGRRRRAGRARGDRHRPPADRRRSPGRPRSRIARGQPAAGVAGGGRRWPAGRRR